MHPFMTIFRRAAAVTLIILAVSAQCLSAQKSKTVFTAQDFAHVIHEISEVMVHDVVGPTSAGRYYAYCTIAAYEIIARSDSADFKELSGILNDFPSIPRITSIEKFNPGFAACYCTARMGMEMLPSGYMLDTLKQELVKRAEKKLGREVTQSSVDYAESVVKAVVQYASKDHYREIFGYVKYTPIDEPGKWKPTPPAYMQALDPYWNRIRPFVMTDAAQFKPVPCAPYSEDTASSFYKQAKETYETGVSLTDEQKFIANYWDDNPFAVQQVGHIDYGLKKISPGGHWMSITGIVCSVKNFTMQHTVQAHALVALAIADGFISCWDEKYRSNRIRPESFINEHIDRNWLPMIQTPPFPEYTSGHSVASNAAATILTRLIGDHVQFTDNTQLEFGSTERTFKSFYDAAAEASISRLYGGIHFRDAIENGVTQGKEIAQWVLGKFGK